MARKLRIQYPGAIDHVMNRGGRREAIFEEDQDRELLGTLRMGWSEPDLSARRKGEPKKAALARQLRSQPRRPLAWIAERLNLGSRGHRAWLLPQCGADRHAVPANHCLLGI
jgi:hypothetical protein